MRHRFSIRNHRPRPGEDVGEEIRIHLEMTVEELLTEGLTEEEAWAEARRRFGDLEEIRSRTTDQARKGERRRLLGAALDAVGRDLRYSVRTLLRAPGMTLLTILILALGIGANTAIFSVLKAVFLEPLPFPHPEELTFLWNRDIRSGGRGPASYPDFLDWQAQNRTFQAMGAFGGMNLNLTGGDEPVRIRGAFATAGVFEVLGVPPARGRTFLPEEDLTNQRIVVLSHALWTEGFDGDPELVGNSIQIDGGGYTVIGIMPEGFFHPTPWGLTDPYLAWVPFPEDRWVRNRNSYSYQVLARLESGVALQTAQRDMDQVALRLEEVHPETNRDHRAGVVPLHLLLYGQAGGQILVVLLAAGTVLLIACGNIAGFLLARVVPRQTEMAVRASLGASRGRILRQLLTESTLLALAGGGVALLLAFWSLDGLKALIPPGTPRATDIRLDPGVLLFAFLVSMATGLLFGLAPALTASRTRLTEALKEGRPSGTKGGGGLRAQNAFVVAQFALGLVLANAGLLLTQSYLRLRGVEQGFDAEHTLTMALTLGGERFDREEGRVAFFRQLLPRLEAIPGVRAAGITSKLPLSGGTNGPAVTEEQLAADPTAEGYLTEVSSVGGDYFASMGIPLLGGRTLTAEDDDPSAPGVVVNQAAADLFWPGQDPLGRRFGLGNPSTSWLTVVGVVGNVRQWGPGIAPRPEVYSGYAVNPQVRMFIILNAAADPRELVRPARAALADVDPLLPVSEIRTMEELLSDQLSGREFYTLLIGLFSTLALLLAAAGIYGMLSYSVALRTRELGIRLALGAGRSELIGLVLGRALETVLWGMAWGAGGVWVSTRILSSLLFDVRPLDPPTLAAGILLLVGVGVGGALIPGVRCTRLSPVAALREE